MNAVIKDDAINIFLDKLVEEKKMENVNDEVREQIKNDLRDRIEDRINAVILEHMPSEKLEDFNKLLDSSDDSQIQSFCQKNIKDLDQIVAKELMNFRATYLNL